MNYEQFEHNSLKKNIFLVDMTKETQHGFSEVAEKAITKYLNLGKRIGILVNKKGYSHGVICHHCGHIPQCNKCSVSIGYHKLETGETIGLCHICKTQYQLPSTCPECHHHDIKDFGMGTQKVAEYIENKFHITPLLLDSAKVNSQKKIEEFWQQCGASKIVIGTSLITKPIKNHPFDLIIVLNADLGLNIPDYQVAERNFYLLYELFTKQQSQSFIVQTFNTQQYSIRFSCKLDPEGFWQQEHLFRKEYNYPPFKELCMIMYKHEIEETLFNKVDQLYKELLYLKQKYQMEDLEIYSTPPLIYKIFGKYRYNIILKGSQLKNFMDIVFSKLKLADKGFKIDRKPSSLV